MMQLQFIGWEGDLTNTDSFKPAPLTLPVNHVCHPTKAKVAGGAGSCLRCFWLEEALEGEHLLMEACSVLSGKRTWLPGPSGQVSHQVMEGLL